MTFSVEEVPGPTVHLIGRCSHAVGLLRCCLPHGHGGLHQLSAEAVQASSLDARLTALEQAHSETAGKGRALEQHANAPAKPHPCTGCHLLTCFECPKQPLRYQPQPAQRESDWQRNERDAAAMGEEIASLVAERNTAQLALKQSETEFRRACAERDSARVSLAEVTAERDALKAARDGKPVPAQRTLVCDFCGKTRREVAQLIEGKRGNLAIAHICNECVDLSAKLIAEERAKAVHP